ncbi:hypothetical protein EMIHUDRAFT_219333 [Emiliania huxleyi CCMP1516]|uniref:SSD domain-containing protein n=2 Tax=Emiliania huxleyi TaxID=2903 RepID=A0A0D3I590_EMIH1|nr:hypothetical protein EMIHUDRAFT_219333 [Emiliania huxleyi CCMP1516]EOD06425.1 hypothetical protein EMIHUDRAFT_219333 [Emiliania huxleyi CCMP1516]|eukprot:XP_005758854.1 hypothetical protein EMIHUDRAFT_219333 [Emiliania huxleyi CCMP1516]
MGYSCLRPTTPTLRKRHKEWLSTRSLSIKSEAGDDGASPPSLCTGPARLACTLTRPRPNVFADIEPGKYSKLNAGRPVCMCFSWLAVYIVLALLMALGLKDFSIMMNFVFSDEKATTNLQFQGFAEASKPENRYESRSFAADNTTYMESAYTYDAFDGGNLFDSADKVSAMARAEEFVLAVRDWTTHCTKVISFTDGSAQCESPKTLLNYLYVSDEAHEAGCVAGFCETDNLTLCRPAGAKVSGTTRYGISPCRSRTYDWRNGSLTPIDQWAKRFLDCCATAPDIAEELLPTTAFEECRNGTWGGTRYARAKYTAASSWLSDTDFEDAHSTFDGLRYVFKDLTTLVPVSVIFIFLFIWLMVGSLFLACAGMLQIFLAFLGGMALWVGVFQQQYIDMFQISAIFLILCIGADDIFVWSDTWKESAAQPLLRGDLVKRHAWTFHRAASGMLNTTATTVICLLLNMASSIPFFWCFGIFNALAITLFPALTCVHATYFALPSLV